MPYIKVSPSALSSMSETLRNSSSKVGRIESDFSSVAGKLDWDVRSASDIQRRMDRINGELEDYARMLGKMQTFIGNAKSKYESVQGKYSGSGGKGGGGGSTRSFGIKSEPINKLQGWSRVFSAKRASASSVLFDFPEKLYGYLSDFDRSRPVNACNISQESIKQAVQRAYGYTTSENNWTVTMRENVETFINSATREQMDDGRLKLTTEDMIIVIEPSGRLAEVVKREVPQVGSPKITKITYYPDGAYEKVSKEGSETSKEWSRWHEENVYDYAQGSRKSYLDFLTVKLTGKIFQPFMGGDIDNPPFYGISEGGRISISVLSGSAEAEKKHGEVTQIGGIGADLLAVEGGAEVNVGYSSGDVVIEGFLGADAMVANGELEAASRFEFAGIEVSVTGEAQYGAGAKAEFEVNSDGKIKANAAGALGLGYGLDVEVDMSDFVYECEQRVSKTVIQGLKTVQYIRGAFQKPSEPIILAM